MPHKNNNPAEESREAASGVRRFRLPKLFADSAEDTLPQDLLDNAEQQSTGDETAQENSAREYSQGSLNAMTPVQSSDEERPNDAELPVRNSFGTPEEYQPRIGNRAAGLLPDDVPNASRQDAMRDAERFAAQLATQPAPSAPAAGAAYAAVLLQEMEQMRDEIESMSRVVTEIREHGTAQDRIFDTLHSELQDYKNDFIYEHLKPVVRPLLFLYDSLEQFDGEMLAFERARTDERREFSPATVRENVIFFRSQLVEALRICEVVPMEEPEGFFDPRLHKAVDVVAVGPELDRVVLRMVRSGWFLNGRVFRPAEVVVGRHEDANGDANGDKETAPSAISENDHATS